MFSRLGFFAGVGLTVSGLLTPPLALAAGIMFALFLSHPFELQSRHWSKFVLQLSVVALGFGINFGDVMRVGRESILYTAISISLAMGTGLLLGRLCHVNQKASLLITAGTAICGGSAIAAIAPITKPNEEELAMSLGTVFTLNSIALFLFPVIGVASHLTQNQFGLWSALAIHDTSSVVGAAAKFGPQALAVGTVVKLTRALWIVPVALLTAFLQKSNAKIRFPWFILLFCAAAIAKTLFMGQANLFAGINHLGHIGLAVTLFLIGTGITARTIRNAGAGVMAQGLVLWMLVTGSSLIAIRLGWVHL